jgi:hypothetical protein
MPGIHSNPTIERRHRTLKAIMLAIMHHTGAGGHLWPYVAPTANHIINLTLSLQKMRAMGRPGSGKPRPLTPFEMFENKSQPADMEKLWSQLHHLLASPQAIVKISPRTLPLVSKSSISAQRHRMVTWTCTATSACAYRIKRSRGIV